MSFFIVMTDISSVDFKLILFQLWIKGPHQCPDFEISGPLVKICHIHVIFQTTSHLKVMLDKSVNNVLSEGM